MGLSNAERQRRYIARLKAAATRARAPRHLAKWIERKWPSRLFPPEVTSQITELYQENAALRRKVAVLEQMLAQQQPMAKAVRQEGLAMTARAAAMTKPNGGVVGFYDPKLDEYYEAGCPPQYPLPKQPWIPAEAWPVIALLWEDTLPDKEVRMALERLVMHRGVWEKLQKLLHNRQGIAEIIPLAIRALWMFAVLRRPPQSNRREDWRRYRQHQGKLWINHPHPTRGYDWMTCAGLACDLPQRRRGGAYPGQARRQ